LGCAAAESARISFEVRVTEFTLQTNVKGRLGGAIAVIYRTIERTLIVESRMAGVAGLVPTMAVGGVNGRRTGAILRCLIAIVAALALMPAGALAFEDREPSTGLHDEAGVLNDEESARIRAGIDDVEAQGAPTVVYLRLMDAEIDETMDDGRQLMEVWDVESAPAARDGIVLFFNLDPDDPAHGTFAIIAGETHFDGGALPQSELDRINDNVTELLADGEMGQGIILGLDLIAERLEAGPPEPSALEEWVAGVSEGPLNPLNTVALLAAFGITFIAWQAWTARPRIANVREIPTTTAPGSLHPAYAGALATGKVNDAQIEATVLELARRGALVIEPDAEEEDKAQIRLLDITKAETDFEARLLSLLDEQSVDRVIRHKSLRSIRNQWGSVRAALRRDLEERGWFNPRATQLRLPFIVPGVIGILLAISIIVAVIIAGEPWPILGAGLLIVVSAIVLGLGSILPSTTREGEAEAIPWRGYRTGLTNARDSVYGEVDLDNAFPYIVAMSMAVKFQKHLKKASEAGYVPDWIGSREETRHFAAHWYIYWIALHTAMAPTDASTASIGGGAATGSGATGGRF
jgi:uncharacterized membrane protein YgcG